MQRGTIIKLLLAAAGIGVVVYMMRDTTPQVAAIEDLDIDTDPIPTPAVPTATVPKATTTPGVTLPSATLPPATQPMTNAAAAALAQAKAANPTLDFSKKLGMLLTETKTGAEVRELQRLLGIAVDGIFGTQTKSKLLLVKGVGSISLEQLYLSPNKYV